MADKLTRVYSVQPQEKVFDPPTAFGPSWEPSCMPRWDGFVADLAYREPDCLSNCFGRSRFLGETRAEVRESLLETYRRLSRVYDRHNPQLDEFPSWREISAILKERSGKNFDFARGRAVRDRLIALEAALIGEIDAFLAPLVQDYGEQYASYREWNRPAESPIERAVIRLDVVWLDRNSFAPLCPTLSETYETYDIVTRPPTRADYTSFHTMDRRAARRKLNGLVEELPPPNAALLVTRLKHITDAEVINELDDLVRGLWAAAAAIQTSGIERLRMLEDPAENCDAVELARYVNAAWQIRNEAIQRSAAGARSAGRGTGVAERAANLLDQPFSAEIQRSVEPLVAQWEKLSIRREATLLEAVHEVENAVAASAGLTLDRRHEDEGTDIDGRDAAWKRLLEAYKGRVPAEILLKDEAIQGFRKRRRMAVASTVDTNRWLAQNTTPVVRLLTKSVNAPYCSVPQLWRGVWQMRLPPGMPVPRIPDRHSDAPQLGADGCPVPDEPTAYPFEAARGRGAASNGEDAIPGQALNDGKATIEIPVALHLELHEQTKHDRLVAGPKNGVEPSPFAKAANAVGIPTRAQKGDQVVYRENPDAYYRGICGGHVLKIVKEHFADPDGSGAVLFNPGQAPHTFRLACQGKEATWLEHGGQTLAFEITAVWDGQILRVAYHVHPATRK